MDLQKKGKKNRGSKCHLSYNRIKRNKYIKIKNKVKNT